MEIAKNGSREF